MLLEKIISKRLFIYLENNNLLNPKRNGFRASRNTTPDISAAYEVVPALANNNIVLRDVAKAFVKLWHLGSSTNSYNLVSHTNNKIN